jgi:hypothetical protein
MSDYHSITMPRELGESWVAALRSGDFEQSTGYLENAGKYCCLGVLQMVADGECQQTDRHGDEIFLPTPDWCADHNIWIKTNDSNPQISLLDDEGNEFIIEAAEANDNGFTFEQIADGIERVWSLI